MQAKGLECHCIRCREYGHRYRGGVEKSGEPVLKRMDTKPRTVMRFFLSFEDERETLFGLLRLRIQTGAIPIDGRKYNTDSDYPRTACLRGGSGFENQSPDSAQHKGLGKALIKEAERIAREEFKAPQMLVLSGVGAREYYRAEFGYSSVGDYMGEKAGQLSPLSPNERKLLS